MSILIGDHHETFETSPPWGSFDHTYFVFESILNDIVLVFG